MRIDELILRAVGPFTGKDLDFSRGDLGLHVVFGPNEAGKSSALQALQAALFGFDDRSRAGFLHGNAKLAVGARLRTANSERIAFVRHKKRKGSLSELETGDVLPDEALDPYLSGLTEHTFATLFGIDHDRLVEGGQEILEQRGDLGQALFAAASGVGRLRTVLESLERQADGLFSVRGRVNTIPRLATGVRDAENAVKQTSLKVKDWERATQRLEAARKALERLNAERSELTTEKNRTERWLRVLPRLARRRALIAEDESLPAAPDIAADFSTRWVSAVSAADSTREQLAEATQRREQLHESISEIEPDARVLGAAARILKACTDFAVNDKTLGDRERVDSAVRTLRNTAREVLRRLRADQSIDDLPTLRPGLEAIRRPLEDLISSHSGIVKEHRKAQQRHEELEEAHTRLRDPGDHASAGVDVGPLEHAAQHARREGDLSRQLALEARKVADLDRACGDELSALGRWPGPLDRIDALPLPGEETIAIHAEEQARLGEMLREQSQSRDTTFAQLSEVERDLRVLAIQSAVPSEDELVGARGVRDRGWSLVRRAWLEGADVTTEAETLFPDTRPLDRAYEKSVTDVDAVADRLRREAERVASRAQLEARRMALVEQARAAEQDLASLARERELAEDRWRSLWAPAEIAPGTPAEMRAWLPRLASLRDRFHDLRDTRERQRQTQEVIAGHSQELRAQLGALGSTPGPEAELPALLSTTDQIMERRTEQIARQKERTRVERELERAAVELERTTQEHAAWQAEWAVLVKPLGLPTDASTKSAKSTMEGYIEVFKHLDEADSQGRRIYGMQKDEERFLATLAALSSELAPDAPDEEPRQRVERLKRALDDATHARDRRDRLSRELEELEVKIAGLEAQRVTKETRIAELLGEAGCTERDHVPEAERRAHEQRTRREGLHQLEASLLEDSAGAGLSALEADLAHVNADQLETRLAELPGLLAQLDSDIQRAAVDQGEAGNELRSMNEAVGAAESRAGAEALLAQLSDEVERYLPLRAAGLLLRREIQRFLEENQSPLLEQAGRFFADLTGNAFRTVRADIGEKGTPVLTSIRADGSPVLVEGLSTGTRDQLFLALRLAAVEAHVTRAEPVPFVVDDVLVQFDDARALATLRVFGALAKRTQVLLFTHHGRIREMAEGLAGEHEVFVQGLE